MHMAYSLRPGPDMITETIRVGRVPTLIVRPKNPVPHPPGVLWIHGGGYMLGMKEMVYMGRAADLVRTIGAVVVSPGYRLSWQKPYPAALEDCCAVLAYMKDHAEELGFRRDQIMVGGESAGGGLAAAVCLKARDEGLAHVAFQMPLYPMLSCMDTESSKDNHGKVWNTRRNHFGWRLYLRRKPGDDVSPYASPSLATDLSGLPPCYTFVGDGEPFYCETLDYVRRLEEAGVRAQADVYPTNVHAFDMMRPKEEIAKAATAAFLRQFEYALGHDFADNP
ncbi:MAG: alpha/beta hydrolase [Clostridia bacterium]|nr:alpha/beta hydrolase [Clostridia bacterium]